MFPSAKTRTPSARVPGIAQGIDPSGAWIYEEGGQSLLLTLDAKGNGAYRWKEGRFQTISIMDHIWTGTWHQSGNDREGGFEINMNADYSVGQGRWWYTRIRNNGDPKRPGGTFTIERRPAPGQR